MARFVQVGSFDGETYDPLVGVIDRHPGWTGTFVEPLPWIFEKLVERRGGDERFRLVRAAITEDKSRRTIEMTVIDDFVGRPEWAAASSTTDPRRRAQMAADFEGFADHFRTVEVPAMTFEELVGDEPFEVLHVDAEGVDDMIVRAAIRRRRPEVIMYEHIHFDRMRDRRLLGRLLLAGYRLRRSATDTLALRVMPSGRTRAVYGHWKTVQVEDPGVLVRVREVRPR